MVRFEAWGLELPDQIPASRRSPHGDGMCAAHVSSPSLVPIGTTAIGTTADTTTTESGGISA
jgi:hypothetical protein